MKIDSHQHFWKYNPDEYGWINDNMHILKNDFLPNNLHDHLVEMDFDGSIAVQARQKLGETEWLLQLAENHELIKGVVGWVDLCSPELKAQLEQFVPHPAFAGVRHVIQDEEDDNYILRKDFIQGIESLASYNLTYDILIFARHLPQTIEFVKHFPQQIFVLDHIAKPDIKHKVKEPWDMHMRELGRFENVYCKLSGMVTEADWHSWQPKDFIPYLDTVICSFGTKRVMIGSDWPVCRLAGQYKEVMSIVMEYFSGFSQHEKDNVFGLNALRAYSLESELQDK